MRGTQLSCLMLASVAFAIGAVGACQPVPLGDSRFWAGGPVAADSGAGPADVQPDGVEPDLGGLAQQDAGVPPPSTGGSTGSGGSSTIGLGSGGSTDTGGAFGTGGLTAAGGNDGSGGNTGSGGRVSSGGTMGSGGVTGSGGRSGTGGASGTGGSLGTGGQSGVLTGTLRVSVTTKAGNGQYSPRNAGAIWIADSSTKFVKSLYVWAERRRNYLSRWTSATSAAGLPNNVVDAVTSATLSNHGTRTATWNGTNTSKALVPDGAYKVCFEMSEGSSQYQCVDFTKGRTAQSLTPADTSAFVGRTIGYTP